MTDHHGSARDTVEALLDRVDEVDRLVNSICTLNPLALDQAAALDEEQAAGRSRGPLHGKAILVKDNVDTADLLTTAGSLALADVPPAATRPWYDACEPPAWWCWARPT